MENQTLIIIGAAVLSLSEALALIPVVRSNSVFQLVLNILKSIFTKNKGI